MDGWDAFQLKRQLEYQKLCSLSRQNPHVVAQVPLFNAMLCSAVHYSHSYTWSVLLRGSDTNWLCNILCNSLSLYSLLQNNLVKLELLQRNVQNDIVWMQYDASPLIANSFLHQGLETAFWWYHHHTIFLSMSSAIFRSASYGFLIFRFN